MASSVLEAIKQGIWNYEPRSNGESTYLATDALPGSDAKLEILAERVRQGLPLWHPGDRIDCENLDAQEFARRFAARRPIEQV